MFQMGGEKLLSKSAVVTLTEFVKTAELERAINQISEQALLNFLSLAQQAKTDLDSNVNHRLVMENLFLTLPRAENQVMKMGQN